jgi:hypothetical protein
MLEFIAINVMGERECALNWIRMEFNDINVTRERERVGLKVIRMDFCGSKCY